MAIRSLHRSGRYQRLVHNLIANSIAAARENEAAEVYSFAPAFA